MLCYQMGRARVVASGPEEADYAHGKMVHGEGLAVSARSICALAPMFQPRLYDQSMETQAIQALAAVTDEGLIERVARASLALLPTTRALLTTALMPIAGRISRQSMGTLRWRGQFAPDHCASGVEFLLHSQL